jgi:transposase InsO family protein
MAPAAAAGQAAREYAIPIRTELEQPWIRRADVGSLLIANNEPAEPDVHMNIVRTLLNLNTVEAKSHRDRAGQQQRRDLEQQVRLRAVQFTDRLLAEGYRPAEAAQRLALKERTLRSWCQNQSLASRALPLGRPLTPTDVVQQQAVISWLDTIGPGIGMPTLRTRFDGMARAGLDSLLKDYRQRWREEHRRLLHVLHWQRPGTVWAMDFAHAPCRIDGLYRYLLAVRDLASGQQLLWQPVTAMTAEAVLAELHLLFTVHSAPLVLKSDNGSAFLAEALCQFLQHWCVGHLLSPPRMPAYNGAIEASIGSLKKRTKKQSELAGHAGQWTAADVEAARTEANTTARPRRLRGATPDEVWQPRRPLTDAERTAFRATVDQFRTEARLERGLPSSESLTRGQQAAVDRVAFRRALVAHDLLLFRRRRIPPQISRPKVATKG